MDVASARDITVAIAAGMTALAAATTAGVAVAGFNKWRSELAGKAHFDCARTVARCVYQLRRAIQDCRSPEFTIRWREPPPSDYDADDSPEERSEKYYRGIYRDRLGKVDAALVDLDTAALEAEALWGHVIEEKIEVLRSYVRELRAAIDKFVTDISFDNISYEADSQVEKTRTIVLRTWGGDADEFTKRMNQAIAAIDKELQPHLSRND